MTAATKRVQMLTGIASSEGWSYAPGQIVDLPVATADAWIAGGIASATTVGAKQAPETAAIEPTENTALARGRKHRPGE